MKTTFYFSILFFTYATVLSQSFNQETTTPEGKNHLTGKITLQKLESPPYNNWFTSNYSDYTPEQHIINEIKNELSTYTIKAFLGTWCGDSKREIPRLYKVLKHSDFPLDRLTTIAVQRDQEYYKQSKGGEHEGLNIHRVPTIIFYKNGKEINRIVESPVTTIEKDIQHIFSKSYTSNYNSVNILENIIKEKGVQYLKRNSKKIAKKFKKITTSYKELNTYAIVLFYNNQKQKAIEVLKLNMLLFPKEVKTYNNIASMLEEVNKIEEAISYYEQSLTLAENEKTRIKISELKMSIQ